MLQRIFGKRSNFLIQSFWNNRRQLNIEIFKEMVILWSNKIEKCLHFVDKNLLIQKILRHKASHFLQNYTQRFLSSLIQKITTKKKRIP